VAFRDESEALRARNRSLENRLDEAQERIDGLEKEAAEARALRARLAQLEPQRVPPPSPPKPPQRKARRIRVLVAASLMTAGLVGSVAFFTMEESIGGPASLEPADPTHGLLDLDAHPNPPPLEADTRGVVDGDVLGSCPGYLPSRPQLVLRNRRPASVSLTTTSSADLVMAVVDAEGAVSCNDDGGEGLNPLLQLELPAGEHRVYVGTYSRGRRGHFTLTTTARTFEEPTVTVLTDPSPTTVPALPVRATRPASARSSGCIGFLPERHQVLLQLDEPASIDLTTVSSTDLVMLVESASGRVYCDDDGGDGLMPRIRADLGPGEHRVYVGTYGSISSPVSADLVLRPAVAPTGHGLRMIRGSVTELRGTVAASREAAEESPGCQGWIGLEPDAVLSSSSNAVRLESPDAVGLVVRHRVDGRVECLGPRAVVLLPAGDAVEVFHVTPSRGPLDAVLTVSDLP
jgi:hypothetical protein